MANDPHWTYSQGTGALTDPDGRHVHTGYSGHGHGRNNCEMQHVRSVGPIPQGLWKVGEPVNRPQTIGPYAIPLTPLPNTETFGRSGFFIHGDNAKGDLSASHGCPIFPRRVRHIIVDSVVKLLKVVP